MGRLLPFMLFVAMPVITMVLGGNFAHGDEPESRLSKISREEIRTLRQQEKKAHAEARLMREKERLVPGYQSGSLTTRGANIVRLGLEKAMKDAHQTETPEAAELTELESRSANIEKALRDLEPTGEKMAVPDLIKQELENLKPKTETRTAPPTMSDVDPSASASVATLKPLRSYYQYDKRIELHASALVDLQVEHSRGRITYPLYHGKIREGNRRVYFVLSEASDDRFAKEFGIMHSSNLAEANQAGIEEGTTLSDAGWQFSQDPGLVSRRGDGDTLQGAEHEPLYSPLKRFTWNSRVVTVNAPFVKWGDGLRQQLIEDHGGCDPNIRGNPPPSKIRGGPAGCEKDPAHKPLARYRGGQALEIDIPERCKVEGAANPCGSVTMKLHRATYRYGTYPYVTIFDASEAATAEQLGIPYVPKLASLGRSINNNAVASLVEFQNGVSFPDGGPARFQWGVTSYASQTWSTYSPIAHLRWAVFDCDRNGKMDDENTKCRPYAAALTRPGRGYSPDGIVFSEQLLGLIDSGAVFITDPQSPVLLNAPSPVTIRRR